MIWQEEVLKDRRKREWRAFYAGIFFGAGTLALVFVFIIKATGGCQ